MAELRRTLVEDVFYPPHEPRKASAEYGRTHRKLVKEMDEPCWICGVRNSDVQKMPPGERARWQLETHHDELEWAAANGVDLARITADFPIIMADAAKLRGWLDSEGNMLVLCATHHRHPLYGIHGITYPAWKLQRWQAKAGFQFIPQQWPPISVASRNEDIPRNESSGRAPTATP